MRACSAPRADQEADNGKGTGWRCSSPGIAPSLQTLTVAEPTIDRDRICHPRKL